MFETRIEQRWTFSLTMITPAEETFSRREGVGRYLHGRTSGWGSQAEGAASCRGRRGVTERQNMGFPGGGAELGTDDEGFCLSRFSVWASFRHFPDRATPRVMLSSLNMRKRQEPVRGESAEGRRGGAWPILVTRLGSL